MSTVARGSEYFGIAIRTLQQIADEEEINLHTASSLIARSLADGGVMHVFGTGHSHLFAEEVCRRAGGLVPVNAILVADSV